MLKNRIIYAVWLAFSASLFVMLSSYATAAVLAASIVLPIITGALAAVYAKGLSAKITSGSAVEKNDNIAVTVHFENKSRLPVLNCAAKISAKNLLTGDEQVQEINPSVSANSTQETELNFRSAHCGAVKFDFDSFFALDVLGITKIKINRFEGDTVIVSPSLYPCEITLDAESELSQDSEEYSMMKSGNDPSETFLIREYIPGDSIKSIHWKLSQKTDHLMVREFGLPIVNSVALLVDTGYITAPPDSTALDRIMDAFYTVAGGLLAAELCFTAIYDDDGHLTAADIGNESELALLTSRLLSHRPEKSEADIVTRCLTLDNRFEHAALFCENAGESNSAFGRLTVFYTGICSDSAAYPHKLNENIDQVLGTLVI